MIIRMDIKEQIEDITDDITTDDIQKLIGKLTTIYNDNKDKYKKITIEVESCYDESPDIIVYGTRPETDKEYNESIRQYNLSLKSGINNMIARRNELDKQIKEIMEKDLLYQEPIERLQEIHNE